MSEGTEEGREENGRSTREIQKTHGTQREYWKRVCERGRRVNTRDVQTPVAKQFFDRISARTWPGPVFSSVRSHIRPDMERRK